MPRSRRLENAPIAWKIEDRRSDATLIVSLGILTRPEYLVIIEIAVVLLTAQAFAINRLAGLDYPLWEKKPASSTAND